MEPGSRKCFLTNSEKPGGEVEQRRGEEGGREGLSWGQPSDPRPPCQQGKPGQPELPFCESCLRPAGLRDQGLVLGTTWWGGGGAGTREGMLDMRPSLSVWASSSVKRSYLTSASLPIPP